MSASPRPSTSVTSTPVTWTATPTSSTAWSTSDDGHARLPGYELCAPAARSATPTGCRADWPPRATEPPADLHGWHHLGKELRHRQADEADQLAGGAQFQCEQPEAMAVPLALPRLDARPGLLLIADGPAADPAHYLWVGVDGAHRRYVVLAPPAQHKSGSADTDYSSHPATVESRYFQTKRCMVGPERHG